MFRAKQEYLGAIPNINNPGVKSHEKFKSHVDVINNTIKK